MIHSLFIINNTGYVGFYISQNNFYDWYNRQFDMCADIQFFTLNFIDVARSCDSSEFPW